MTAKTAAAAVKAEMEKQRITPAAWNFEAIAAAARDQGKAGQQG